MNCRVLAVAAVTALACAQMSQAAPVYFEGFEAGWAPNLPDNWQNNSGSIVQTASGTNGITSSAGAFHAVVTSGPFTRFGGYSSTFGGGFQALHDVYLDSRWNDNTGFEISVAANKQDGNHLRDFIWHVGKIGGNFYVNASNNTNSSFDSGKLLAGSNLGATAGWYTLENLFYNNGGVLAVDLNIYGGGNLLQSFTLSNPGDLIASVVGGNRYGWITQNNVVGGVAIDNSALNAVPEPGSLILLGLGAVSAFGLRRRNQRTTAA